MENIAIFGFENEQQLNLALKSTNLEEDSKKRIIELSKNCVWLETQTPTSGNEIQIGVTKIGGHPDLPVGIEWPMRPMSPEYKRLQNEQEIEIAELMKVSMKIAPTEVKGVFEEAFNELPKQPPDEYPLSFVAQINFAQIAREIDEDFPKSGILSIFFDNIEQPWGFDILHNEGAKVLFFEDNGLVRKMPPIGSHFSNQDICFNPLSVKMHKCIAAMPYGCPDFNALNLSVTEAEAYWEWWSEFEEISASSGGKDHRCHRIGGWPTPLQGEMQTICELVENGYYTGDSKGYKAGIQNGGDMEANQWLLLAQFGSDEKAGMFWGDSGQIYIWIKRKDLKNRNFDRARIKLQCL